MRALRAGDSPRVRRELPGLRGAQGLAAAAAARVSVVARCTVERLMGGLGLQGVVRGRTCRTTTSRRSRRAAARPGQPAVPGQPAESAVGGGLHVRGDVGRLRLRGLRDRRVRAAHRRLARRTLDAAPTSSSTRWSKPCGRVLEPKASSITATGAASTSRFATPSGWRTPASSRPSAASATRTTTRWPSRSSACSRRRSFNDAARGDISRPSNSRPSNGSTGSTTAGCWNRSATCRRRSWSWRTIASKTSGLSAA